ncbi:MAG: CBS domain-containing protein [Planctomycetes bacterium]|nr:CBS domain-containing protein [Planctomycetota bacterium]
MTQPIGDYIVREACAVVPSATLVEAARLMRDRRVGALPVLEEGEVVGIVTDRDLVVKALAAAKPQETTRVREVMTANPDCLREDDPVSKAIDLMSRRQVHRIPIVDRDWRLVGVLSVYDLLARLDPSWEVYEAARALATTRAQMPLAGATSA